MKNSKNTLVIQKLYRSLFPVQVLALGLPAINTLVNSFIVGSYLGENALAAIGFTSPITQCVSAIAIMLCNGSQMICGRYLGKGDRRGLNSVFTVTVLICVIIGVALTLAFMLAPYFLASLMGATGEVAYLTGEYIKGCGAGVIFTMLTSCLISFLQTENMKKTSVACTIVTLVVNIGGNFLNALYLHWGIFGVSLFMSLSGIASGLIALAAILFRGKILKFSLKTASPKTLWYVVSLGFPGAVGNITVMISSYIINFTLFALGGTVAVAAMAVAGNIYLAICDVIDSGNSSAIKIISSVLIGHRDASTLRNLPKAVIKNVYPVYAAAYALIFIFAKPLALLMGAEDTHIDIFVTAIRLYNLYCLLDCLCVPAMNIYQALGRIWEVCAVNIIAYVINVLLVCFVLTKLFGINAVFCVLFVGDLFFALFILGYYIFHTHRLPKSPLESVYIPDSLSAPPSDCMDMTVSDVDGAIDASRRLYDFCVSKGLSKRTAYAASLCVEEIAVDTVKNRFENKKSAMDLRVIYENGGLSIMTRDDCPHFDPKEWLELCSPEDESRSIGIKMAMGMARDTNYVSTLGLNVLMIKL